jgi:hypothetical protein
MGGAGGADPALVAKCKMTICIDPVFDCILQGCGFASCEGFVCVIH